MHIMNFQGLFNIFDFNISHKVLLIRNTDPRREKINIDIIFYSVFYLDIPTLLIDFSIRDAREDETAYVMNKYNDKFYPEMGDKILVISTNEKKYYIGCNKFVVTENSLINLKSSIR